MWVNLIRKDILIQKKMILFALGYSIFLLITFHKTPFLSFIYSMGASAISYMFIQTAMGYDFDVVINSLPLKRKSVVIARYMAIFIFIGMALAVMGVMGAIIKLSGLFANYRFINIMDSVITFASMGVFASIYLPLFYKFGKSSLKIINVVFFMALFFSPGIISDYAKQHASEHSIQTITLFFNRFPDWVILMLPVIIVLLVLLISLNLSIKIYNRKDF